MSQPFLGMIIVVPYNFAPRGWAFCSGQLMSISQNTALFALLGTTYGGNGQTTFGLPDLRGRVAISSGQGPGLSNYSLGQQAGVENVTLTTNQMPAHNHSIGASGEDGNSTNPANRRLAATTGSPPPSIYSNAAADTNLQPTGNTGGSQPFSILQPYLTLNYCIALQGIFPSRN